MDDTEAQEFEAAFKEAIGEAGETPPEPETTEAAEPQQEPDAESQPPKDPAPNQNDIWANAPEELKTAFNALKSDKERLEHRLRSDDGRVSTLQRQRDEARKALAEVTKASEQEDIRAYMESDEWKKVKADYGEDLAPLFKSFERLVDDNQRLSERFTQLDADQAEQQEAENFKTLAEKAPDYVALLQRDDFGPWLTSQPSHIQEAFEQNRKRLVDPFAAADVISRFRAHAYIRDRESAPPSQPQRDQKRERQLEGAISTKTRTPVPDKPTDESFEAFFAEAVAAEERKSR